MKTFEQFMEHHQKDAQGRVVEHGDGTPSSVEEENALEKRAKENEKARKWLKKDAKDSGYTDIALKASMSKGAGVSEDYYRGTGEKVVARTKKWMDKKGQKGAPGLDAMKARTAEHKAKRGVKEEVVDETYFDTNRRGISTKGGFVKQYNKPGKLSRASLNHERKSKNPELRMSKKELRKSMEDDANYEKKMGRSKPTPSNLKTALKKMKKEEVELDELNRYGKETGKATGSINKRPGTPVKRGGGSDKALNFVRNMIRKETGKPEGQRKKIKGEKGRVQYGDRKVSPSTTIAKRRQAAKDADAAMRDTRGT